MSYRYIGNKSRLAPWLVDVIAAETPPGSTVADLMCGTASFSAALSQAGYRVVAGDIMTFASFHAVVRLTLKREPDFDGFGDLDYPGILELLNQLDPVAGYFHREFSPEGNPASGNAPRQYFSSENAARIDAKIAWLNQHRDDGDLTFEENALLRHDLVLAGNRVANIVGTYGHYWSKWNQSSHDRLTMRPAAFDPSGRDDHLVIQGPVEEIAGTVEADLCYLDPPYTKRQYAANYHVLETIARGDEPDAIGVSGLRPWRDQYSDFCSKVRIREAFTKVIQSMDCPKFVISYSEDGLLSVADMEQLLGGFGSVTRKSIDFPRFRSNQSPLARELEEYAFVLDRTEVLNTQNSRTRTVEEILPLRTISSEAA